MGISFPDELVPHEKEHVELIRKALGADLDSIINAMLPFNSFDTEPINPEDAGESYDQAAAQTVIDAIRALNSNVDELGSKVQEIVETVNNATAVLRQAKLISPIDDD